MTTPVPDAVAWPCASSSRRLGHPAGAYRPGYIVARRPCRTGEEESVATWGKPVDRVLTRVDKNCNGTVLHAALSALNRVATMPAPSLLFSAAALDEILDPTDGRRQAEPKVRRPIDKPTLQFGKIDVEADAERWR